MNKFITALFLLSLSSCSWITLYKVDVQQGNYVTQEMIDKLKPGMSKSQVRFALGSPLLTDMYHANRWDYVYLNEEKGRVTEHRRLAVFFEDEKLKRVEGDVKPKLGNSDNKVN